MDAGAVRDYAIVISGGLIIISLILVIVFGLLIYREIKKMTRLIQDTISMGKDTGQETKQLLTNLKWLFNIFRAKKPEKEG